MSIVESQTVDLGDGSSTTTWVVMFDDDPVRLRWWTRGYRVGRFFRTVGRNVAPPPQP